jgi:dihydroneopterin aldolase
MSDRIHLYGVELDCRIGVTSAERAAPQRLLLDVSVEFDTRAAAESDDVRFTIDYAAVLDALRRVASVRVYALVETLAERIASAVLAEFPVDAIHLIVKKPGALRERGVHAAAIEIERRKAR